MIPFGSQRALGQDLATHLLNEYDNELMEVAEVRGAIAQDLHGAFAEWEVQAHSLTKCQNYLYSLSINPDPAQEAGTSEGPQPQKGSKVAQYRRQKAKQRDRDKDRGR